MLSSKKTVLITIELPAVISRRGITYADHIPFSALPPKSLRDIVAPRTVSESVLMVLPEEAENNYADCRRSLTKAVDGDTAERDAYLRNRIIHLDALPQWAQREIHSLSIYDLKSSLEVHDRTKTLPPQVIKKIDEFKHSHPWESVWSSMPSHNCATYSDFQEVIKVIERETYRPNFEIRGPDFKHLHHMHMGGLTVYDSGPLGEKYVHCIKRLANYCLTAQIIEDATSLLPRPVSDGCKLFLLRENFGVDTFQKAHFRNLLTISKFASECSPDNATALTDSWFASFKKARDPVARIKELLPKDLPVPAAPKVESPKEEHLNQSELYRQEIRSKIELHCRTLQIEATDESIRQLRSLILKDWLTVDRALELLSEHRDVRGIVMLLLGKQNLKEPCIASKGRKGETARAPVEGVQETKGSIAFYAKHPEYKLSPVYSFVHGLDISHKKLVWEKIYSLSDRKNHIKGIVGGEITHIQELTIDKGPGYRVYFSRKEDKIILLAAGKKKHQVREIKKAEQRLVEINRGKALVAEKLAA